jgi:hypothetical protein
MFMTDVSKAVPGVNTLTFTSLTRRNSLPLRAEAKKNHELGLSHATLYLVFAASIQPLSRVKEL